MATRWQRLLPPTARAVGLSKGVKSPSRRGVLLQCALQLLTPANLALGNLALGNLALGNLALGNLALGNLVLGNLALGNLALGNLASMQI